MQTVFYAFCVATLKNLPFRPINFKRNAIIFWSKFNIFFVYFYMHLSYKLIHDGITDRINEHCDLNCMQIDENAIYVKLILYYTIFEDRNKLNGIRCDRNRAKTVAYHTLYAKRELHNIC